MKAPMPADAGGEDREAKTSAAFFHGRKKRKNKKENGGERRTLLPAQGDGRSPLPPPPSQNKTRGMGEADAAGGEGRGKTPLLVPSRAGMGANRKGKKGAGGGYLTDAGGSPL
ncbi:unnamed protein product [Victoria cruziana]